jgi:indolepyruvate ferredoxin oxidoreductase alpha subunit
MSSSQNEQDNRRYALAAGLPMLEPSDSQEAYDVLLEAMGLSERFGLPAMLRMTTRVCHSKSLVERRGEGKLRPPRPPAFERDIPGRVMIPGYARPAHRKLRAKLEMIQRWAEASPLNLWTRGDPSLGIVTCGITYQHVREAAPGASVLRLGTLHPLPLELARAFAGSVKRCLVVEEGDPYLVEQLRAGGVPVEGAPAMYRFGEMSVERVRRILSGAEGPEGPPPQATPPRLCDACPYHPVYDTLKRLDCIVAGDIGCYTLGVMEPYRAMDTCVAMGASLGVGLGLRHVLPEEQARRVVSVIGDSTFVHSGVNGLVEMVYNPPPTGHVVVVLDNGITAMTGQQEHPGTGRTLEHEAAGKFSIEGFARACGVKEVHVVDPVADPSGFESLLRQRLAASDLALIVARKPCVLAAADIRKWDKANAEKASAACAACEGVT